MIPLQPDASILAHARWRKSSYSNNGAGCVELAVLEQTMAVRDSKHPAGPVLTFTTPSVRVFLATTESDRLPCPPG